MTRRLSVLALVLALGGVTRAGDVLPFHGLVAAVDAGAGTLVLSGPKQRVLHLVPTSKVERDGTNASLAVVVVGEAVSGSFNRADTNRLVVVKARFGVKRAGGER